MQQKKAWSDYASKKGLAFTRGTFFGPCTVEGIIEGYSLSCFSATQQNEDPRKNRELTVVQISIDAPFIDSVACGTAEVLSFLQSMESLTPHDVKVGQWNKKYHIRTRNKKAVDIYLTEERVKILTSILSMPNAHVIILMDEGEAVFRFETANPLKEAKQLDTVVSKLVSRIHKLQPTEEEAVKLAKITNATLLENAEAEEIERQKQAEKEAVTQEKAEEVVEKIEDPKEDPSTN